MAPHPYFRLARTRLAAIGAAALLLGGAASAEPHVPRHSGTVLERVPAASAMRELAPLRAAVARNPQDLPSGLQLAQRYLELSRRTSDPRFVSYAMATLAPWSERPDAPARVLVLEATALQSLHRFEEALARLDRALALEPRNAQAWLTKASLLQVRGEFAQARAACRALGASANQLLALTCTAGVDGMTGRLRTSYAALQRLAGAAPAELSGWMLGQIGDMAVRLGELGEAETHLRAALDSDPEDPYLLAAYADLLLLQNKPADVLPLLRAYTTHDQLLLRLAIAARRSAAPEAERWFAMFDARRRAARADDNPHLREHARFELEALGKPRTALDLARRNWALQREPADVALYLRAARLAASAADERAIVQWVRQTGYEDRTLGDVAELRVGASVTIPRRSEEGTLKTVRRAADTPSQSGRAAVVPSLERRAASATEVRL